MLVNVELTGTSPLMFNRMTDEAIEALSNKSRSSVAKSNVSPREEAAKRLHLNEAGQPVIPTIMLHAALVEAGRFHKWGKKQLTSASGTIVPAFMTILGTEAVIKTSRQWEVDSRPIHNQNAAGYTAAMSHRPKFYDWSIDVQIEIEDDDGDPRLVRALFDTAGKKVGLGSYRVQRGGPFGKFVVTRWEVVEQQLREAA